MQNLASAALPIVNKQTHTGTRCSSRSKGAGEIEKCTDVSVQQALRKFLQFLITILGGITISEAK